MPAPHHRGFPSPASEVGSVNISGARPISGFGSPNESCVVGRREPKSIRAHSCMSRSKIDSSRALFTKYARSNINAGVAADMLEIGFCQKNLHFRLGLVWELRKYRAEPHTAMTIKRIGSRTTVHKFEIRYTQTAVRVAVCRHVGVCRHPQLSWRNFHHYSTLLLHSNIKKLSEVIRNEKRYCKMVQ